MSTMTSTRELVDQAAAAIVPACPTCGGARVIVGPATPDTLACATCRMFDDPQVGLVPMDCDPETGEVLDEDLPPPPPEEDEELPPPPEETPAPAAAELVGETSAPAMRQLVELLPADFPLPTLIKFTPDPRLRQGADDDATRLLAMQVTDKASMHVVDACVLRQKDHVKTIIALFEEPAQIADRLHKGVTGLRADWIERSNQAISQGNTRVLAMQRQLEREAAEKRRRDQEEADRLAREQAAREAEAARQANAPTEVVQQLEFESKTATAPPVTQGRPPGGGLRGSTVVANWKARLTATDRAALNLQPTMANLSPAELACVKAAMKAVLEGRAPITIFEIDWSTLNARAKSDMKTFALEGFMAEDLGSLRSKPGRR